MKDHRSLRAILRAHQRDGYAVLMRAPASTIMELARDPRYVGGTIAVFAVLHTWDQQLNFHPHVVGGTSCAASVLSSALSTERINAASRQRRTQRGDRRRRLGFRPRLEPSSRCSGRGFAPAERVPKCIDP